MLFSPSVVSSTVIFHPHTLTVYVTYELCAHTHTVYIIVGNYELCAHTHTVYIIVGNYELCTDTVAKFINNNTYHIT